MAEKLDKSKFDTVERDEKSDVQSLGLNFSLQTAGFPSLVRARTEMFVTNKLHSVSQMLKFELETGLGFHLIPVFLGFGIVLYFYVPSEPIFWGVLFSCLLLWGACTKIESRIGAFHFSIGVAVVLTGMLAAQIAVMRTNTSPLYGQVTAPIVGTVLGVDRNSRGSPRYLLIVHKLELEGTFSLPERVRLSARSRDVIEPGDVISGLARVQAVSGPAFPGSYDFGFFSRFQHLDGTGFFMGGPKKLDKVYGVDFGDRIVIAINGLRQEVSRRFERAMPNPKGRIVTALVTGDKSGIAKRDSEVLRASGLAHILAISGLHMALVTLTVMWVVRLIFSLKANFVYLFPIKKIAALAGFFFACCYLVVSGGGIATQRAWIMVSVMLLAVMMDRRALTMRSVAISALLILLARPYSLFSPGFQMSFAAVAALVAGYEVFQRRDKQRNGLGASGSSLFSSSWRFISGLSLTSLIAGSATLFISAWHFHQIATLGLIANVLAMPLVSLVLMPFILLSALMLPFGLESITLIPVSLALDWILGIAERISALTPLSNVGAMRPDMAILFCLGFVVLIVFRSRLRLLGLVILVAMPFFYEPVKIPDLVIAESGRAAGLKGENGNFQILFPSRENFITGIWTQAYARGVFSKHASDKETCNRERCIIELYGGTSAHIVYNPDLLDTSCRSADILIAPRLKWVRCRDRQPQRIIKRHDFEQYGAHAIYLSGSKHNKTTRPTIEIQTSLPEFSRPWHRNVPSYDD